MFWQREIETMPREELQRRQLRRLRKTLKQAAKSPFYAQVFKEQGISPAKIKSLWDIKNLPFTTKEDLRAHYPFGFYAYPRRR